MPAIHRTGRALWEGTANDGVGSLTLQSGTLAKTPYTYNMRFGGQQGTNPEELIAAAHAGCFAMALAYALQSEGCGAVRLDASATVTLEVDPAGGFKISKSALVLEAFVSKISTEKFGQIVQEAKANCPVSKLMNAEITLDWKLS